MKKTLFILSLCLYLISVAVSQTAVPSILDEELLGGYKAVTYIEDKSPVSKYERSTAKELLDVGRELAAGTASNGKYLAFRSQASASRSADVIFIGRESRVTTTRCLFLIVAGYLEALSSLKGDEAYKTAERICYWNSAHYEDMAYFTSLFGEGVLSPFAEQTKSIGLSLSYKEWKGRARIIVPWEASITAASSTSVASAAVKGTEGDSTSVAISSGSVTDGGKIASSGGNTDGKKAGESIPVTDDALLFKADEMGQAVKEDESKTVKKNTVETAAYVPKRKIDVAEDSALSQYLPAHGGVLALLGAACLAALMLLMLLIKVIMDLSKDR